MLFLTTFQYFDHEGKHAQLKPILMTLIKIQRVPVKK
jgi:hypothetical protein